MISMRCDAALLCFGDRQEILPAISLALREIGEYFGGHFPLIASRTKDARHQDPSWSVWAHKCCLKNRGFEVTAQYQSSRISSVKRFFNFIPAAPKSVRTALAVRPWRPITFPKSSGCTRNSNTVTCDPSTDFTSTSSGWSTRALAIASTSSFIWATPLELISSGNLPRALQKRSTPHWHHGAVES